MQNKITHFNWDFISRLFIGLLFIVSGLSKISNFASTSDFISGKLQVGAAAPYLLVVVIFIEVVVSILFISGIYKRDFMAYVLICFTAIVTVLIHNDYASVADMQQTLKNLAIIGGLLATLEGVHRRRS